MLQRALYYEAKGRDAYHNIATEQWLTQHCGPDEIILYLWRNDPAVVIGRCQNIWSEVRVDELRRLGAVPVRRLSGGGAVWHDRGNLNFTFITSRENSDIDKQTSVVLQGLKMLGVEARKNGRNDLCAGERKFSGHSFCHLGDNCFHNGTIMVYTNPDAMARVLNVSPDKLQSKGVKSVRSRTVNLDELVPNLSVHSVMRALKANFASIYDLDPIDAAPDFESDEFKAIEARFRSDEWIYGKVATFTHEVHRRYPWGSLDLKLDVRHGIISGCTAYTDALDPLAADIVNPLLVGMPFSELETFLDGLAL